MDANARLHQLCCNQANSLSHKPKERTAAKSAGFFQEKAKVDSAGADCFNQESARQASRQPGASVQSGSCKLLRTSNQVRTGCNS